MGNWQLNEVALWELINESRYRMSLAQRRLWDLIRIDPEQWIHRSPTGNVSIWVVALIGRGVISYNDAENGFDRSSFVQYGEIVELGWGQDELEGAVQHVLNELELGYRTAPGISRPQPGEFPDGKR
ncbi:hypothetical protein FJV80_06385 [Mesorhizobium sp. WSM4310]|nr:hypothetical protein FJV80_06385 [Mesorhizobium sp. WSM4310]